MNWRWRVFLISLKLSLLGGWLPELQAAPTASGAISLRLSWSYTSSEAAGFGIDRAASPGGPWRTLATLPRSQTSYQDTGLRPLTTYYYRVWAYNSESDSGFSNIATVTTPAAGSSSGASGGSSGGSRGGTNPNGGGAHGGSVPPGNSSNLPRPPLLMAGKGTDRATVSFPATNGLTYTLEFKNMLSDTTWTAAPGTVSGTNGMVKLTDSNAPSDSRFYRVRVSKVR